MRFQIPGDTQIPISGFFLSHLTKPMKMCQFTIYIAGNVD